MDAFFSGTDNANENMTQFYAVWGKVEDEEPAFAFRYVVGNSKIECDGNMLIDWPVISKKTEVMTRETFNVTGDTSLIDLDFTETESVQLKQQEPVLSKEKPIKGPFKMVDYPEDWMTQHSKPVYTNFGRSYPAYSKYGKKSEPIDMFDEEWDGYGYGDGYGYNYTESRMSEEEIDELVGHQNKPYIHTSKGKGKGKTKAAKKSIGEMNLLSPEEDMQEELLSNYENEVTVSAQYGGIPSNATKAEIIKILRDMYIIGEDLSEFEN